MIKRAQVTAFVIIGITLLFLVVLFIYLNTPKNEVQQTPLFMGSLNNFVDSCLKTTTKTGLIAIGLRAGYYEPEGVVAEQTFAEVPYYFYEGEKAFPDKERVKKELTAFISDNIDKCINNFSAFPSEEFTINDFGYKKKVSANFIDNYVLVDLEYPIDVLYNGKIYSSKDFEERVDFDFNKIYNVTESFVDEQEKDLDVMPLGKLSELAYENNFTYQTISYEDSTVFYELVFNDSEEISPYVMAFAVKYNWTDLYFNETGEQSE